jgi:RimJ/RimL family protein N-acetyltransferase
VTSIDDVDWPLTTDRLSIRPSAESDAAAFHAYRRKPEVSEWLPRLSTDLAAVEERFREEDFRRRTLVVEHDGRVVGDLYLAVSDCWTQAEVGDAAPQQAEVGWALDSAYQGRGLALEAVRRLVDACFAQPPSGLGLHRVYATCFADNTGSWRLMEKLGMRREAHNVNESLHREHGWLDGYTYALRAEEWSPASSAGEVTQATSAES